MVKCRTALKAGVDKCHISVAGCAKQSAALIRRLEQLSVSIGTQMHKQLIAMVFCNSQLLHIHLNPRY